MRHGKSLVPAILLDGLDGQGQHRIVVGVRPGEVEDSLAPHVLFGMEDGLFDDFFVKPHKCAPVPTPQTHSAASPPPPDAPRSPA